MKVPHTVWCNISGEAVGEIWNWSLLGVKGLMMAYLGSLVLSILKVAHKGWRITPHPHPPPQKKILIQSFWNEKWEKN